MIGLQIGSPSKLTRTAGVGAVENRRRIGLHALDVVWSNQALVHTGQHAVERDDALLARNRLGELADDGLHLFAVRLAEVGLGDGELLEADEAIVERDAGPGLHLDGADQGLVGALGRIGHGRVGNHVLLRVPTGDLRLIQDQPRTRRRRVRPRPPAVNRRRRGRRLGRHRGFGGLGRRRAARRLRAEYDRARRKDERDGGHETDGCARVMSIGSHFKPSWSRNRPGCNGSIDQTGEPTADKHQPRGVLVYGVGSAASGIRSSPTSFQPLASFLK